MDMFEKASRQKLKFETNRGLVSTDDLWDIPLKKADNFDLDSIARNIAKQIKDAEEVSFVDLDSTTSTKTSVNELRLDIVKHVIKFKVEEADKKKKLAELKAQEQKLLAVLERKQDQDLESKSIPEIQEELAKLKTT